MPKPNKSLILFLTALAAFLLGISADFLLRPAPATAPEPNEGFPMRIITVKDAEEHLYDIYASYPQFDSLPDSFNESIRVFVDSQISGFKSAARENMEVRRATLPEDEQKTFIPEPFYFSAAWSPSQMNEDYVSFAVRTYAYEGGANGSEEIATWNYNVRSRRDVSYMDLFPEEGDNYLEKISKAARESLVGELGFDIEGEAALQMLEDGTKPKEENFTHFTFTDEAVTVYFEKYQVAPGSFGEQRVVIPRVIVR